MKNINLQLYSVARLLEKDFFGTLDEIARIGYSGVEFAGYYDIDAKVMKKELEKRNLKAVSSHVALKRMEEDLQKEIAYLKELDCDQIVCPWTDMDSLEKAKKNAEILNKLGEECVKNDLTLSYHNHAHEFEIQGDTVCLDYLYQNTDPRYLKAQIDVYWVAMGKQDPYEYVKKYADRMNLVHLKQFKDFTNVDAPDGTIDFRKIVDLTNHAIPIYEQEGLTCENGILSITRSFEHMNKVL